MQKTEDGAVCALPKVEDRPVSRLLDLSGRKAVVTGGAAGIGYAIAGRLAEAGASVLLSDLNPAALQAAASGLAQRGYSIESKVADIGREADVVSLFEWAAGSFGGVDILVNNAGVYPSVKVLEMSAEQWRDVQRINLEGSFLCSREAGRQMVRQARGGVIINIASMAAFKPCFPGLAHYGASKGGVVALTRSLALELAPHQIRAVSVAPGGIWTQGTRPDTKIAEEGVKAVSASIPLGNFGHPDDIARTVLFLASDAAAYITGTTISIDGGAMLV
ncbi:MAG: SDR family oxidoreductase [Desulfuromonadales bacterium]|nr:SDR family oxidoreductase [Desulfuromonadales bacterium]